MSEKARRRLLSLLPAAAYLAVVLVVLGKALFSGALMLSALGEDLGGYYVGMRQFGFSELARGNLALWNPLLFSGIPYMGNFESALLYPPNWLYCVLPLELAVDAGIALHLFMAGFFTFLWRRRAGAGRVAAWLSGLLFMLSGPYFLHIYPGHLSNLCVMAWTPLLFLALDGWFESEEPRWCLLGAAVVSLQILAGHPQYVYYTAMGAALYTGLRLHGEPRAWRRTSGVAALYAGAALLCAVQVLTGLQTLPDLSRGVASQYDFARTFSFPPENLATLLLPNLFGDISRQAYFGRWHLWETCLFTGSIGLFLALHGAAKRDARGKRTDLWMAVGAVFLGMGAFTPLYDVLYHYLPGYGMFRGTAKFIYLAALFIAALAGTGFDRLLRERRTPPPFLALAGTGVVLTALWAWMSLPPEYGQLRPWQALFEGLEKTKQTFFPPWRYHSLDVVTGAAAFAGEEALTRGRVLLLAALALYLAGYWRRWVYGLAVLAVLEMLVFARGYAAVMPAQALYPPTWREATARLDPDERVLHVGVASQNPVMAAGVADMWGYTPLYPTVYGRLMDFLWKLGPGELTKEEPHQMLARNPILALLRCRLVLINDNEKKIVTVPILPRVLLVEDWIVMREPLAMFRKMVEKGFDTRKTVILQQAPDPAPERGGRGAPGSASVTRSSTDWLDVEAELTRPAVLLVTDAYSRHWRARPLPGSAQSRYEVLPADAVLRAVPLSAGRHRLRMEYRPSGFELGKWVSLASLLVFALLCRRYWRSTRS